MDNIHMSGNSSRTFNNTSTIGSEWIPILKVSSERLNKIVLFPSLPYYFGNFLLRSTILTNLESEYGKK